MTPEQAFAEIGDELEAVRRRICPYPDYPVSTCGCKYGISYGTNLKISEKTGCPELRLLIQYYRNAALGNRGS